MRSVAAWIVGRIVSPLRDLADAPLQADEGAPPAWIVFEAPARPAARDLEVGAEIELLTWLDRGDRTARTTHPRGDPTRPALGVFSTRAPDRPNPIGLHRVRIAEVRDDAIRVDALEAVDGTPVLDIKPVLSSAAAR